MKLECLDCLTDLLRRFGHAVADAHPAVTSTLLAQLSHERKNVQKRATSCLGALAMVLSDGLLNGLVSQLLESAAEATSQTDARVLITAIGQVSRSVGHRIGRHLDAIVPLFLKFLGDPADEALHTEAHNELRETCLQGFESFVLRCPRDTAAHLPGMMSASVGFMKFDPNYCGDDDDDDEGGSAEEDEEYSDDDDALDDEDDDTSWKLRRAAVKVLAAAAGLGKGEVLGRFYAAVAPEVVVRFKEREENVRLDVIECATTLVRTTYLAAAASPESVEALAALLPTLMGQALKQLAGKDEKTKSAVLGLLRQLVAVLPGGGLAPYADRLVAGLGPCFQDKAQALRLDALVFLRLALESHPPAVFRHHLPALLPLVLANVAEDWCGATPF